MPYIVAIELAEKIKFRISYMTLPREGAKLKPSFELQSAHCKDFEVFSSVFYTCNERMWRYLKQHWQ